MLSVFWANLFSVLVIGRSLLFKIDISMDWGGVLFPVRGSLEQFTILTYVCVCVCLSVSVMSVCLCVCVRVYL